MVLSPSLEEVAAALRLHFGARVRHESPFLEEKAHPRRLDGGGVLRLQHPDQIVDPHQLVEDVALMVVRLRFFRRDDIEGEARKIKPPLVDPGREPRQKIVTLRGELQLLRRASAVAQKELDPDQHVDRLVQPDDDVVVAMVPQRLDADPALVQEGHDREQERDQRHQRRGQIELQARRREISGELRNEIVHTITLPCWVTASSIFSAASPKSISLWARPDGIIGKQFSFGSTTQSKITAFFTSIISLIAASSSSGFSQRMPTA